MRIFFTTDIHGSDRCFRKFLNAGKYYGADVLIHGADITGKAIVPLIDGPGGTVDVVFHGERSVLEDAAAVETMTKRIADAGYYSYRCPPDEAAALAGNPERLHALFIELMIARLDSWMRLAEERLDDGMQCYINAGNDDPVDIDGVLGSSERVVHVEGRVVELPDGLEMASCGYGNPTPWDCPRDLTEEQLGAKLEAVAGRVRDPHWAIFNFHVPPFDTQIDLGPKLGDNFQMKMGIGGADMHPVGSTACRDTIERYQPMLGLHGHLHESRGTAKLHDTTCLNPGSEYSEGVLRGAVIDIDPRKRKVKSSVLTVG